MQPVLLVLGLWVFFIATHIGLAAAPVRERLSKTAFVFVFSAVAWVGFAALVAGYSTVQSSGPAGLGLASIAWARTALLVAIVLGVVLMIGAFAPTSYWDSPTAILMDGVRPPRGLGRVSRHPFFAGTVLVMGSHALLAAYLTGTVFFAGFVFLAVVGPMHQERKLRARHGEPFDAYLETTSAVPFAAIARGKQRLAVGELPWAWLGLGLATAYGLHRAHSGILAWYGAPMIVTVIAATIVIGLVSFRRRASARARAR